MAQQVSDSIVIELNNNNSNSNNNNLDFNSTNSKTKLLNEFEEKLIVKLKQNVWLAAVFSGIILPILCIVCYIGAVYYEIIDPVWPYVSDTGGLPPIACYFSTFLDASAISNFILFVARYKQIKYYITEVIPQHSNKEINNDDVRKQLYRRNFHSLLFGLIVVFGGIGVGNFRSTENLVLHFFAALPLFVMVAFYSNNQLFIAKHLYKCNKIEGSPTSIAVLLYFYVVAAISCTLFSTIAMCQFYEKYGFNYSMMMHWKPDQPGFVLHVIGAISEYAALFLLFPLLSIVMAKRMKQFQHWDKISF